MRLGGGKEFYSVSRSLGGWFSEESSRILWDSLGFLGILSTFPLIWFESLPIDGSVGQSRALSGTLWDSPPVKLEYPPPEGSPERLLDWPWFEPPPTDGDTRLPPFLPFWTHSPLECHLALVECRSRDCRSRDSSLEVIGRWLERRTASYGVARDLSLGKMMFQRSGGEKWNQSNRNSNIRKSNGNLKPNQEKKKKKRENRRNEINLTWIINGQLFPIELHSIAALIPENFKSFCRFFFSFSRRNKMNLIHFLLKFSA